MLFNKRLLKQKISKLSLMDYPEINAAKTTLLKWQTALLKSDLDQTKETGVQGQFLIKIFEGVLGYKTQSEGDSEWNMFAEPKTDVDSREADGGLGFFNIENNQTRVVIELKDAKTNLDAKQKGRKNDQSPVEQAFDYLSKFDGCKWAIVSNFKEIRLYSKERGQGFYEEIDLLKIHEEEELKKFIFLFSKNNLINKDRDSVIDDLLKDSFVKEQDISKAFYKTYKETRNHLFNHLSTNNPNIDANTLLEKAQKILDRVIFICFCEDLDLIPAGIFRKLLEAAKLSFAPSETKVWDQAKGLFHSIDKGNPPLNINKFNGGLFKEDQVLDNLIIKDEIILELLKLSEYDFDSDLNVNILGHIFEQSISDLEEMRSEISEEQSDKKSGKRKKDGIFYTPEYITRYIVDQAVGGWLMDRKKELGFESLPELTDDDFKSIKTRKGTYKGNNSIEKHRKFWEAYKEKLRNIKVLDPACGSGAFLNQVFDYLYKEGQVVNEAIASLKLGQAEIFDLDKHILNNNIFGVDLNEESVQITKLSLWLKTANKSKELTTLDENIKCGNSLIDDPEVAGEKAFNWKVEFKEIFDNDGFDVVVGNPPWGAKITNLEKKFFYNYFQNFLELTGEINSYTLFMLLGYKLLADVGKVGLITPEGWTLNKNMTNLREFILNNIGIEEICLLRKNIFEDAPDVIPTIMIFSKNIKKSEKVIVRRIGFDSEKKSVVSLSWLDEKIVDAEEWKAQPFNIFTINQDAKLIRLYARINQSIDKLSDPTISMNKRNVYISDGVYKTNLLPLVRMLTSERPVFIQANEVNRYRNNEAENFIDPDNYQKMSGEDQSKYKKEKLVLHAIKKPNVKYRLAGTYFEADNNSLSPVVSNNFIVVVNVSNRFSLRYLLGLLNSKFINRYYSDHYFQVNIEAYTVGNIPIFVDTEIQSQIENYVTELLKLNQRLVTSKKNLRLVLSKDLKVSISDNLFSTAENLNWNEIEKILIKHKMDLSLDKRAEWIAYFDKEAKVISDITLNTKILEDQIDRLVYKLYGLTEEEVHTIESYF